MWTSWCRPSTLDSRFARPVTDEIEKFWEPCRACLAKDLYELNDRSAAEILPVTVRIEQAAKALFRTD